MDLIETARLHLRKIEARDWPLFLALNQNPEIMRYVAPNLSEDNIKQLFDARIQPWNKQSEHWLCLIAAEKDTDQIIGTAGLSRCAEIDGVAEVGYMLKPEFQGRGYATECLDALIKLAIDCGFESLSAKVTEGNSASERVLKKCCFYLAEQREHACQIGEVVVDDLIYRRTL